jgi:hypothetical protein
LSVLHEDDRVHAIGVAEYRPSFGRLLIALYLESWRLLSEPLLYLSHYYKAHRRE